MDGSLARRFFDEVRAVRLGEKTSVDFDSEALIEIALDARLSAEFCEIYRNETQDPILREMISDILHRLAQSEENASNEYRSHVATLDRYVGAPALAAMGAAAVAILAGPVTIGTVPVLGALVLLGGGGAGVLTAIYGRTILGRRIGHAQTRRSDVLRLLDKLKEDRR